MPGTKYFSNLIEKMQANPSKECPPGNDPNKIEQTYDGMILNLLQQVADQARKKVKESNATTESEKEERASARGRRARKAAAAQAAITRTINVAITVETSDGSGSRTVR